MLQEIPAATSSERGRTGRAHLFHGRAGRILRGHGKKIFAPAPPVGREDGTGGGTGAEAGAQSSSAKATDAMRRTAKVTLMIRFVRGFRKKRVSAAPATSHAM
jgi:hypothetical protein